MAKKRAKKKAVAKSVETINHQEDKRKNIPTAEMTSVMEDKEKYGRKIKYPRNTDLDPQLVWRGKDEQDWSDLVVDAPPLYIQEKVHPKVLIDDLLKQTKEQGERETLAEGGEQLDIFGDFNGLPEEARSTEFYEHEANWTNRMILGDSLQVMASLAEREGLRGEVQCIYIDPPYGIKFNSNFQWSTTSRDVKDGKSDHITREPEQVKAFRDTWRDGIHSYLTYLRDRLTVARDLLSESGSIFVQIGDENLHLVRGLMDEVLGAENFVIVITFRKTNKALGASLLGGVTDYVVWYAKNKDRVKYRTLKEMKTIEENPSSFKWVDDAGVKRKATKDDLESFMDGKQPEFFTPVPLTSSGYTESCTFDFELEGKTISSGSRKSWATTEAGVESLIKAGRIFTMGKTPFWAQYLRELSSIDLDNVWQDTRGELSKSYVVQTSTKVIERCMLMTTDPGDLILDPTCGSGTTAHVGEQWARRWIAIDSSRVALALARARLMGSKYPYYLLADSAAGVRKEAEIRRQDPVEAVTRNNIRQGFVYNRIPRVTLKLIAANAEISVIWEKYQPRLDQTRKALGSIVGLDYFEWDMPKTAEDDWTDVAKATHAEWSGLREERQREIDVSIANKADFEYLYDRPYENKSKVRVAGPFTVESLSPHRTLGVDENDELIDPMDQPDRGDEADFATMVLDNLKKAGVQQSNKEDKIDFSSITLWPGRYICAEARYTEGEEGLETEKRAGIFIGPEFGTVSREDLVGASRECGEADFDVLISCAFNYEAHAHEFNKLGKVQVLKAHMNADLHMGDELATTGKGNLFVVFGEPDIEIIDEGKDQIKVKINGVDIFHPNSGEIRSDDTDGIACWFIDSDYNEESFFVRHAYFLGAGDPYKSLKTTLKAEINQEAWETLNSDTSRPFKKPGSGRIAVKVINHLGDEVMKVFKVD